MEIPEIIDKETLKDCFCLENVDRVSNDEDSTNFKRRARYQQSLWRQKNKIPIGYNPYNSTDNKNKSGSRIELEFAKRTMSNFLTDTIKSAVIHRLNNPEPKQTLRADRLYADCLSSMPMCFNLFGSISADMLKATNTVKEWWPDTPGSVTDVRFEWSPGRQIPNRFLENRSAFDSAIELQLDNSNRGLIGIETKYHEDCKKESKPSDQRLERYKFISENSGVFKPNYFEEIIGTELQQLWQDHILALSILQDTNSNWEWVKFVLVYPSKNQSFKKAADRYKKLLVDTSTFEANTIESLLSTSFLEKSEVDLFRERYIW
jgi:hypothetical protein